GGDITLRNNNALFVGKTASDLSMMIRATDPAPGLPGLSLGNSAGTIGISGDFRLSPDGRTFWSSWLSGPGVVSTNDTAIFGGFPGSLALIAREGDPAPGTAGAVFYGDLNAPGGNGSGFNSTQFTAINRNGTLLFESNLTGGDTTPSNNA